MKPYNNRSEKVPITTKTNTFSYEYLWDFNSVIKLWTLSWFTLTSPLIFARVVHVAKIWGKSQKNILGCVADSQKTSQGSKLQKACLSVTLK
jgi:hypothetical protein